MSFRNSDLCPLRPVILGILGAVLSLAACGGDDYVEVEGPSQLKTLSIKGKRLMVEIAADTSSRQLGLMFRKPESLPRDQGMLFVSRETKTQRFHMSNTEIPLSIAFVADDGKILQIEDMRPKDEGMTESKDEGRIAIEVHQGWFRDNGIGVGDRVEDLEKVLESIRAE